MSINKLKVVLEEEGISAMISDDHLGKSFKVALFLLSLFDVVMTPSRKTFILIIKSIIEAHQE